MFPTLTLTLDYPPFAHSRLLSFARESITSVPQGLLSIPTPGHIWPSLLPWLSIWSWLPVASLPALAKNFLGSTSVQFHPHVSHFRLRMSFSFSCEVKSLWAYTTSRVSLHFRIPFCPHLSSPGLLPSQGKGRYFIFLSRRTLLFSGFYPSL